MSHFFYSKKVIFILAFSEKSIEYNLHLFLIWYNLFAKIYTHTDIDTGFLTLMESLLEKDRKSIMNRIAHIRDSCGGKPVPPTAKPLRDIGWEDLAEIRVHLSNGLLARIHYFVDIPTDTFIILNAYIKPDGTKDKNSYNKSKYRSLEQEIHWYITEALQLKKTYITNPEYYELLNQGS